MTTSADSIWYLRLVCCGMDDGIVTFPTWEAADEFRESYTSPGNGHERAAILQAVSA